MEAQAAQVLAAPMGVAQAPPLRTTSYFAPRIDNRADIASAKAEMAVVLAESFREDINSLRDALQHANQIITTLQAENASLRAALAQNNNDSSLGGDGTTTTTADADADADAPADADEPINRALLAATHSFHPTPPLLSHPNAPPDLQRPPPEGTIFCNGGPYSSAKTGERSNHNIQLKKELNEWTRMRGYTVKIYRSRLEKKRAKLIISCVLAGRPRPTRSEQEEHQRREQALDGGSLFRKQRISKLSDCPLKFSLLEMVEGSGTFLVKHVMDPNAQRCNHQPVQGIYLESDNEN